MKYFKLKEELIKLKHIEQTRTFPLEYWFKLTNTIKAKEIEFRNEYDKMQKSCESFEKFITKE